MSISRSYTKLPTFNELPRTTDNLQENNFINIETISSNEHHQRRNSATAEDTVNANDVAPMYVPLSRNNISPPQPQTSNLFILIYPLVLGLVRLFLLAPQQKSFQFEK